MNNVETQIYVATEEDTNKVLFCSQTIDILVSKIILYLLRDELVDTKSVGYEQNIEGVKSYYECVHKLENELKNSKNCEETIKIMNQSCYCIITKVQLY